MGEFCGEVMIMWKGIDVSDNQGNQLGADPQECRFCNPAQRAPVGQGRPSVCRKFGGLPEA